LEEKGGEREEVDSAEHSEEDPPDECVLVCMIYVGEWERSAMHRTSLLAVKQENECYINIESERVG
tara:strand:- start:5535 stop:5732 length:198 start_codon:yes stop_codon:yes gene_type:complete